MDEMFALRPGRVPQQHQVLALWGPRGENEFVFFRQPPRRSGSDVGLRELLDLCLTSAIKHAGARLRSNLPVAYALDQSGQSVSECRA
jgi:hypothetical protein